MTPIVVLGLDGATFKLLDPWMDQGHLPYLRKLRDDGCSGILRSSIPPVTAPAWQCFMTGKNPGKHGVSWFMYRKPDSYDEVPINSADCDGSTLWELLSQAGYRVAALNIPGTYPPRPINGVMITGLLTPSGKRDFVYPPGLLEEIEGRFGPYHLKPRVPPFLVNLSAAAIGSFLRDCQEMTDYHLRVARYVMERDRFDVVMVHILATDMIQHWLWHLLDSTHPRYDARLAALYSKKILGYYQDLDRQVGTLLEQAHQDCAVIVLSDHGFAPVYKSVDVNVWLLRNGYLHIKPGTASRTKLFLWHLGCTPNALYRGTIRKILRLPMVQKRLLATQPSRDGFQGRARFTRRLGRLFLSAADIDWRRTRAYAPLGFGQICLNVAHREPLGIVQPGAEYEALRDELVAKLEALVDPATGTPIRAQVFKREDVYQGKYLRTMPDIIFLPLGNGYVAQNPATFLTNQVVTDEMDLMATHTLDGILVAAGPLFRKGQRIEAASIMDLTPTLLYLAGVEVPRDLDGRVLEELFEDGFLRDHPISYAAGSAEEPVKSHAMSTEDQEDVLDRLRGLGYID